MGWLLTKRIDVNAALKVAAVFLTMAELAAVAPLRLPTSPGNSTLELAPRARNQPALLISQLSSRENVGLEQPKANTAKGTPWWEVRAQPLALLSPDGPFLRLPAAARPSNPARAPPFA